MCSLFSELGQLKDSSLIARKFTDLKGSLWATPAFIKKHGLPTHPRELKKYSFVKFASAFNPLLLTNGKDDLEGLCDCEFCLSTTAFCFSQNSEFY